MAQIIKTDATQDVGAARATVLNLADVAAEARAVVLDARKEAARLVADAQAKADEICRAAREEGYGAGLACGRTEGARQGRQEAKEEGKARFSAESAELTGLLRKVVEELSSARAELLHRARCEMLDFAVELAEKIVGRVAVADVSAAQANLDKAMELVRQGGEIVVKANPAQLDCLREYCRNLVESLGMGGPVRLAGDPSVGPGGVKVVSGPCLIDATVQTQLANVVEALLGRRRGDEGRYVPDAGARSGAANPKSTVAE